MWQSPAALFSGRRQAKPRGNVPGFLSAVAALVRELLQYIRVLPPGIRPALKPCHDWSPFLRGDPRRPMRRVRYEVGKEWLKVMGAMALLAVALSVGVFVTSSQPAPPLQPAPLPQLPPARIADAPRLLKEKEDAQRAELAQRAAAEEEARRRWQQAQVTYTWWSYSYWYSWYHR